MVVVEIDSVERTASSLSRYEDHRCRANSLRGAIDERKTSYSPVEAARRVLQLLKALNEMRIATVADLHRATALSKPTIVRMLETLISEGYVVRDNFVGGYRVTSKVCDLASGFGGAPAVIEASRPWTVALTNRIKWPVSLGILHQGKILVSFTTAPISPWAYPFPVLHLQLDLVDSALGRAVMANCSEHERSRLISAISAARQAEKRPFSASRLLLELSETLSRGYSASDRYRYGGEFEFVAVPIFDNGVCVAAMGVGFYRKAVKPNDLLEQIIRPMQRTADAVGGALQRLRLD